MCASLQSARVFFRERAYILFLLGSLQFVKYLFGEWKAKCAKNKTGIIRPSTAWTSHTRPRVFGPKNVTQLGTPFLVQTPGLTDTLHIQPISRGLWNVWTCMPRQIWPRWPIRPHISWILLALLHLAHPCIIVNTERVCFSR